jgi:hypothetical protein
MLRQTKAAPISAVLLVAAAGIASAQGSITQDPGKLTPGNLTFQNLGPTDLVPRPTGSRQTTQTPPAHGTSARSGAAPGPGTSSTGFGAGNTAGFGGKATDAGR